MFKKLVVLKLFAGLLQGIITAFHPVTENSHVLVGHVFQQLYTRDWFNCIQACHDEPRCISYNYERSAGANGLCELNECGVEDLCDRDKSLIYSMGFVFQQIRQSKKEKICSLDKSAPPASPKNVTMVNKTSTSLFIKWDAIPDNNQRYGNILGYMVNYTLTRDDRKVHIMVICAEMVHVNLTRLRKFRNYRITVLAFNQHGLGPPSDILFVETEEARPDAAPQNVTAVIKSTPTSILVTWGDVPSAKRQGVILKYKVYYAPTANNETKSTEVNASTKYLKIDGLDYGTNYTIEVSASTSKGYGPASAPIFVATDQDLRPSAPPRNVRAVNKTVHSIGVKWGEAPESQRNFDIKGYTIRYRSFKSGEPLRETSVDAPTSFATLENLTINTNYSIAVLASNQHGNGPPSVPTFVTTSDGSVFQCPAGNSDRWFKDPDSCYRYYRCDNSNAFIHGNCSEGTEFKSSPGGVSPCHHPGKPYCHV